MLDCPPAEKLTVPVCRSRLPFVHRQKCQQNKITQQKYCRTIGAFFASIMKLPPCLSSCHTSYHNQGNNSIHFHFYFFFLHQAVSRSCGGQARQTCNCLTAVYLQRCTHWKLDYTFSNLRKSNRIQQLRWYCHNLPKSPKTNWSQVTASGACTHTARLGFCAVTLLWIVI